MERDIVDHRRHRLEEPADLLELGLVRRVSTAPQYRVKDGIAYLRGFIKPDFISPTGTWSGTSAGNDFLTIPADARQAVDGVLCYDTRAKLTTGADTVRVDYRVMSDGSHRLWLTNDRANGAGYPFDATGWISLSGLSWPVG